MPIRSRDGVGVPVRSRDGVGVPSRSRDGDGVPSRSRDMGLLIVLNELCVHSEQDFEWISAGDIIKMSDPSKN